MALAEFSCTLLLTCQGLTDNVDPRTAGERNHKVVVRLVA